MSSLATRLQLPEAVGLSLSVTAPTVTAAFNMLYRNVYPVPEFPNNLWPYVASVWVIASWALMRLRPGVVSAPLPNYL